ncbi:MAG: hypothetical protein Q8P00_03275 [Dehalococcoidia bacterium]|nr:hypothetical protein [Dehalococcoidia bacterium]
MFIWWQYTITFAGSLIVALVAVLFSHWLSDRRGYRKSLQNLRSEASTNIENTKLIKQWIDRNLDALKEDKIVVAPCPHLYESAWFSARGEVSTKDYAIATKLEDAYGFLSAVNDLFHTIEELKWGIGAAMMNSKKREVMVLETIRAIIDEGLLPNLTDVETLLEKKLKTVKY